MVDVELVYIPSSGGEIQMHLSLNEGATVADVIAQSGLLKQYPEIEKLSVGVFSKPVTLDTLVKSGDRVEIYRPLLFDPKEKRRQRAKNS